MRDRTRFCRSFTFGLPAPALRRCHPYAELRFVAYIYARVITPLVGRFVPLYTATFSVLPVLQPPRRTCDTYCC